MENQRIKRAQQILGPKMRSPRGALGEKKKVAAVKKEGGVRAPPPPALFILELPGSDDPG